MAGTVLGINLVPAFMPATWTILALFYIKYDLMLLPVVVIGAAMATTGRVGLYYLAKFGLRAVIPKKLDENFGYLGEILNIRRSLTIPLVLFYAYLPVPSNQIFVAAGLAKANIKIIAISFFFGRLLSYAFWISTADKALQRFQGAYFERFNHGAKISAEIIGFALIILMGMIPWKKVLAFLKKRGVKNDQKENGVESFRKNLDNR